MNILLLNGAKAYAHSGGRYNDTLHETARGTLAEQGHALQETRIDDGYSADAEVDKWLWADVIILQMPGWWMGTPWTVKRYLDEVLTTGHGKLYASDGRSRQDPTRQYGSGGLLQGKRYLLSLTWNAPQEAFDAPGDFFEGRGVDAVYFPVHKALEFLGMSALPTFLANDVIKAPAIDTHRDAYQAHLIHVLDERHNA
ncbi:NAD(P)H-dependent oxidoreductase [Halomonas smyrnensis]|uniref:NAD(P)H-dependent oxidoreductase n=1 Tax=Halomonas smyrnensis TaxID=720605 RepID=UPI000310FD97|nr:NAD(P)H-dependent oxidoreductase [Halomonas smyrnensis]